eukprot:TRINITY_DN1071_c0_g2_i3.p1 TRINITY_DN1071_c0_g2~~TRINITY_DN1071_c0_g2_i3.p1  ORF type:complete len:249 (-),score=73.44 TRINITY_DN1071_c0_g2_i3:388-1134(-)
MYNQVESIWNDYNEQREVANHEYILEKLTVRNLKTLIDNTWLNDEVINAYVKLILRRDQNRLNNKIHIFNTFFYQTLEKYCETLLQEDFNKISRILKRAQVRLSRTRQVFFPINVNNSHWLFAHINITSKAIYFYDSLQPDPSRARVIMGNLKMFLKKIIETESSDPTPAQPAFGEEPHQKINIADYENYSMEIARFPQQRNGSDCGVFMLKGIEYLSRGKTPSFSQGDIPFFRRLITYELVAGQLLN